jgi:hypothetical protein
VTDIYFRHAKYTADIYVDPLKMTLIGGEHIAGTIIQGGEEEEGAVSGYGRLVERTWFITATKS